MSVQASLNAGDVRQDGFGVRRLEQFPDAGRVEVLRVSDLFANPAAEQAIRARAARMATARPASLAPVVGLSRSGQTLSIAMTAPEGVTLADLLSSLEFGTVTLPDEAVLELSGGIVRAVAELHAAPGAPAHGALSPAHVLLRRDGGVLLTGAMFAEALQSLQYNREQFWRSFGIALPPSASLPRFDQRTDVTQLGALILAILLRRPLQASEYPRGIHDLVNTATDTQGPFGSAMRMWLQQTLQLHAKAMFASAVDAARAYDELFARNKRRAGLQALQSAIRQLCGTETVEALTPV